MNYPKILSYGCWQSPITSDLIVSATIGLSSPKFDGSNIYWLESRPSEGGRSLIVKYDYHKGITEDITPQPFNVRTRVHEYGGGAFLVHHHRVYFTNFSDQKIYVQEEGENPKPLTPESSLRYADFILDKRHQRLICVAEDHHSTDQEPTNKLVAIDLKSGAVTTLTEGKDFYASPTISPDNSRLAWISWNHPDMPWDNTELYSADIDHEGNLVNISLVAGGKNESICQPQFSPNGILYFSSDRTQWWNIYRQEKNGKLTAVYPLNAEFGYPHWVFGESVYGFSDENKIICTYTQNGMWYLAILDTQQKALTNIQTDKVTNISYLQVRGNDILFVGNSPTQPNSIIKMNMISGDKLILQQSSHLTIHEGYFSQPQPLEFPTSDGETAYAWYYPPHNKDYQPPTGELPPLLVKSHGGPTAMTTASYNLRIQYWTSRGFAFVDVNYGGSTGYGRQYRERLKGNWGIVDVEDCVNVAKYLVKEKKVDGEKLAISGGSAGGYTTLAALTFYDTFKAGASYYGVSDLEVLATDTHKFESRYLDSLIGKYPEEKELYHERSPLYHIDRLSCPVIFFQGLEDKVVPPNQSELMYQALKNKGIKTNYVTFVDEQHGFRKAENIKKALEEEFNFYAQIFGFSPES